MSSGFKKVNLGSGTDYIPGWINVDIEKKFPSDITADLRSKFPFDDDSIDELKAQDILEHFTKEEGEQFLRECYRVLKLNGVITIRTHNIYKIYKQFKADPWVMIHFIYGDTKETGIFGAHKYAYTENMLRFILRKTGFEFISYTMEDTNFIVTAKKIKRENKNLTIGIIQQTPDIGGAETYMESLVSQFHKEAHNVVVASNNDAFLKMFDNEKIYKIKIPFVIDIIGNYRGLVKSIIILPLAIKFYLQLLTLFKKKSVDVIIMSGFSEKMLVTAFSQIFNIPVVWIEYGRLTSVFKRNLYFPKIVYRLLKNIPKKIIIPSKNTMQSMTQDARVSLSKLSLIPCGVKIENRNKHLKKLISKPHKKFIIGNVSRLTREKGQDVLIKALIEIKSRFRDVECMIIGKGPDKQYYEKLISENNLEDTVKLTGFVKNIKNYYKLMDIFIFPTVWELEGFGLVIAEAMSYGVPVIASNTGPVPEIIDDNKTGLLFTPGDEKDLARKIIYLLNNKQKRTDFAAASYQKVKEKYDIKLISKQILQQLQDAVIS